MKDDELNLFGDAPASRSDRARRGGGSAFDSAADAAAEATAPLAARMRPRTLDDYVGQEHLLGPGKALRELIEKVRAHLDALPWVEESRLRFSEEGRYLSGSIILVTGDVEPSPERLEQLERDILDLHWRMLDVAIMPRTELAQPLAGLWRRRLAR